MSRVVKKKSGKIRTKALLGHFKRCTVKDVHDHIKFVPAENRIDVWYFMMGAMVDSDNKGQFAGDDDEFLEGQFFGKVIATNAYPYGPPNVEMLTPTGVFPLKNTDFCIDIGRYHKNNYPATIGMDGYVKMIWSGLVGWRSLGSGINLMSKGLTKIQQLKNIRKASSNSQAYNKKYNSKLVELFRNVGKKSNEKEQEKKCNKNKKK